LFGNRLINMAHIVGRQFDVTKGIQVSFCIIYVDSVVLGMHLHRAVQMLVIPTSEERFNHRLQLPTYPIRLSPPFFHFVS